MDVFSIPTKHNISYTFDVDGSHGSFQKTTKYPELFITPPPTVANPQSFTFGSDVSVFPVDTMIPQLPPESSQKHEVAGSDTVTSFEAAKGASNDFDNLLSGKQESDLSLLMSLLTPENKEKEMGLDFAIPSDFNSLFELVPDAPNLDLTNYPPSETSANMQTGIDFWQEPNKELPADTIKISAPVGDPFVAGVFNGENLKVEPQESPLDNSAPSFDEILTQLGEASPANSIPSPEQTPMDDLLPNMNSSDDGWDDHLKDLFEKTFDLETNYMLPPAKRVHESSPSASPSDSYMPPYDQGWAFEHRQSPSPPLPSPYLSSPLSSPEEKPVVSPPLLPVDATGERGGGKAKNAKSTILFGKHENEIIYKLLVPQLGPNSKPITRDKLVLMPVEEFNHLLEQAQLSEIEVAFMKEWRRRGKNKAAAQIARKRKRDELSELDVEVEELRRQRVELQLKYDRLRSQIATLKKSTMAKEDLVYQRYSKEHGTPVSRETHLIHVVDGNKVMLVPRISSQILLVK